MLIIWYKASSTQHISGDNYKAVKYRWVFIE